MNDIISCVLKLIILTLFLTYTVYYIKLHGCKTRIKIGVLLILICEIIGQGLWLILYVSDALLITEFQILQIIQTIHLFEYVRLFSVDALLIAVLSLLMTKRS